MPAAVRPHTGKQNHATAPRAVPNKRGPSRRQFTVVESITRTTPAWLPWAIAMQKATKPIALLSLSGVLILYGVNTLTEREWGTKLQALEQLKSQTDALVTLTERQKYQIPRELEVAPKDYVELKQDRVLFIEPEELRPEQPQPTPRRRSALGEDRSSIGY